MSSYSNVELIKKAVSLINVKVINASRTIGDCACVIITDQGNMYTGVNIGGHVGICTEQSAASAMVTAGEYKIDKIVVARMNEGRLYIIPPCGKCREFLTKINEENMETQFILDKKNIVRIKDLLPYHKQYKELT